MIRGVVEAIRCVPEAIKMAATVILFLVFFAVAIVLVGTILLSAVGFFFFTPVGRVLAVGIVAGVVAGGVVVGKRRPYVLKYLGSTAPYVLLLGSFARGLDDARVALGTDEGGREMHPVDLKAFEEQLKPLEHYLHSLHPYPVVRVGGDPSAGLDEFADPSNAVLVLSVPLSA
jgi:hypothetical protein